MVADLDFDIEIVGVPTQRDDDGLALSSRNVYLDDEERARAVALPRALGVAARAIGKGGDVEAGAGQAREMRWPPPASTVDYVALVDAETLAERREPGRPRRLLAAARMGGDPADRQYPDRGRCNTGLTALTIC